MKKQKLTSVFAATFFTLFCHLCYSTTSVIDIAKDSQNQCVTEALKLIEPILIAVKHKLKEDSENTTNLPSGQKTVNASGKGAYFYEYGRSPVSNLYLVRVFLGTNCGTATNHFVGGVLVNENQEIINLNQDVFHFKPPFLGKALSLCPGIPNGSQGVSPANSINFSPLLNNSRLFSLAASALSIKFFFPMDDTTQCALLSASLS